MIRSRKFLNFPPSCMLLYVLLCGFIYVLCGCAREPKLIDKSFITEQPCTPPCWYGLKLNESKEEQIYAKLAELPFVDQTTIRTFDNYTVFGDPNGKFIFYRCVDINDDVCGSFQLAGGKLKDISSNVYYELSLQTVVDKLGTPLNVNYGPQPPHGDGCMLLFKWAAKNITVSTVTSKVQVCEEIQAGKAIDPKTRVSTISYTAAEGFVSDPCKGLNCVPWPGFMK